MKHAPRRQRTLERPVSVNGFGLWSGRDVRVEFRPADANAGIVFVREDLPGNPRIAADVANRIESPRRTTLTSRGAAVEMVEHVMAALAGLRIDNCEVAVNAPEMPGCDGSSLAFVEALDSAGIIEQESRRPQLVVREPMRLGNEDAWIEARPADKTSFWIKFRLDYGLSSAIGRQTFSTAITPELFRRQLAACRTFLLKEEADWLRGQGLARRTTFQDVLVYDEQGPIDNAVRFEDECVRHKILDLLGDLALVGCDLVGHFVAYRSGHRLNAEMARALLAEGELREAWRRSA